jgi:hypothetical protein
MNNKTPPSQMLRVPTVLIPAVKELTKIHRQGHTTALIQKLQELIAEFDSGVLPTSELQQIEASIQHIETHLSKQDESLATKLEMLTRHLEKIERTITSKQFHSASSRSGYQHQQQAVEIKSFAPENLAQRLGVSVEYLANEWETKSEKEFISWSRNRDPSSLGWKFQGGLYYPVKQ